MADNLHEVVKLLLARMESHPEEFIPAQEDQDYIIRDATANRWWRAMSEVQEFGSEEEKKAIATKLRVLRLQQAHEWAMDELCNGEDRRRKERERHELEKQRYAMAQQTAMTQGTLQQYQNQHMYSNMQSALGAPSGTYYETTAPENTGLVATMKKALGL